MGSLHVVAADHNSVVSRRFCHLSQSHLRLLFSRGRTNPGDAADAVGLLSSLALSHGGRASAQLRLRGVIDFLALHDVGKQRHVLLCLPVR